MATGDTASYPTRTYHFTCPRCGQRISMLLDLSAGSQTYIEDCEVCCEPIEIAFEVAEGGLVSFEARAA